MKSAENKNIGQADFIALLRCHNAQSMELLYNQFAPVLYGVIWRIIKNERDAEEILTKTFVHIWKNSSSFDESKQNLCVWMIGIARDFAHQKVSFRTFLQNREILSFVDIEQTTDEKDNNAEIDAFDDSNGLMSVEQKLVLDLIFFGGGKINEVAEHIGIKEEKVRKLLREALNHYRKQLEQAS